MKHLVLGLSCQSLGLFLPRNRGNPWGKSCGFSSSSFAFCLFFSFSKKSGSPKSFRVPCKAQIDHSRQYRRKKAESESVGQKRVPFRVSYAWIEIWTERKIIKRSGRKSTEKEEEEVSPAQQSYKKGQFGHFFHSSN